MKVVISGYIGKKITGIGRNLICLLDNSSSNIKYVIYTNYDMKDDFKFKNPNVIVKTYNVSKMSSLKNLLWTTFVFPFVVKKEKADRALIPNFTLLLFKFRPTVVIMHDLIEFNIPDKFSKEKMFYRTRLADPITARKADHIITVSNNSKRDIMKYLRVPEDKITVIYNGVDQEKFKKMDAEKASEILKKKNWPLKFILYAGTIDHPGKNAISVVKAFEKLRKSNEYEGQLVLAGMPGSGYEIIADYINSSTFKNEIILTGFVSDQELVALYSMCDVFCFVSLYEGFGIPPLEALSCGAKVIVSNTSSLPEVVGTVGITVSPNDIDTLEQNIKLVTNGEFNLQSDDVSRHLKSYDWKNLSSKFEAALQE